AALHESLGVVFPMASILRVDTDAERVLPDAVDCAVVDAAVNGTDGIDVLRALRARGFDGAAVVLVKPGSTVPVDELSLNRLGARACGLVADPTTPPAIAA